MADNTTLNVGASGDVIVTREISHGGDTSKLQGTFVMGISGTEGSYTAGAIGGDATNGLDVDVTRLPALVAGTANIGDVDVASIAAGDNNIGNVDIASIAAGDNNIGNVDVVTLPALAAGTNNIGDVDVLSVVPGTSATSLGKAVDAVAGATDSGVALLAVRDDALTTLTPADGDYVHLRVNSTGALHAHIASGSIAGIADDAAFTPATSEVLPVGYFADEGSTDSVDEGDIGAARMTLDRKQIATIYAHAAAGGHSPFKSLDLDETEEEVKGSGGKLFWVHAMNLHASSKRYLKIYNNTAAGTTVGTTVPDLTFPIPATDNGFCFNFGATGLQMGTGITVAATTGFADNDTGAPGANEVVVNLGFI